MWRSSSALFSARLVVLCAASCGGTYTTCAKYEAELECMGITRENCEREFESCTPKERRLMDDKYECMFDLGVLSCEPTMTETFDWVEECAGEFGLIVGCGDPVMEW